MRKLASIQKIESITPINGRDRIVLAVVEGWQVIVRKDEYQPGDLTVFVEPDAILPERPEFEFLRPKKFRIKTMKMGGVLSQGICFPLDILPSREGGYEVGTDVTDLLGIKKYEPYEDTLSTNANKKQNPFRDFLFRHHYTRWLGKLIFGGTKRERCGYPDFVAKTDEERIQNLPSLLANKDVHYVGREKIDGTSGTFYLKRNGRRFEFGVCSRNMRLDVPDDSVYWAVANKYNIRKALEALIGDKEWVCIQGECISSKVQGNKYKVSEPALYCFNLIYPDGKVPCFEAERRVSELGLKWAPLVTADYVLPDNVNDVLTFATGKSALVDGPREGIVFRNYEKSISFKAVSPDFLIQWDE